MALVTCAIQSDCMYIVVRQVKWRSDAFNLCMGMRVVFEILITFTHKFTSYVTTTERCFSRKYYVYTYIRYIYLHVTCSGISNNLQYTTNTFSLGVITTRFVVMQRNDIRE